LLIFVLLQSVSAQFCSFWNNGCIDSLAQTAIRFDLEPLFPDPVTLYYAFDASASGKGEGPMTKTAFWLGYQNNVNRGAVDSNRTSEIGMRVGNLTGTPSGTNNGCDGIWGSDCSSELKGVLQRAMYHLAVSGDYYSKPLEVALNQMLMRPPPLPSCPPPVLDVASIPVQGTYDDFSFGLCKLLTWLDFAKERVPDQNVTLMPPGSGAFPWQVWYIDGMNARQQANQVAVGIISRGPSYNSAPPDSPDDIMVELVCVQAPSSGSSKGGHD
jgi:hypothetical protein